MDTNFLLLNANKTELLVIRLTKHEHQHQNLSVNIDDCIIYESSTVKNLIIKAITKTAFFHPSNVAKIRLILSLCDAET